MKQLSVSDDLTGLINKCYFTNRLNETIAKARRYKIKFMLAMLDIDHFKAINDSYGLVFGDFVLKKCARIIQESVRGADLVARYGGEVFKG
ncbi:MAG: GGDEF domain-containing protein [Eubacteriales bacterium]